MNKKQFLLAVYFCLVFISASAVPGWADEPDENSPSATLIEAAVGQGGGIFENYYKFVVFIEKSGLGPLIYQNARKFELHHEFLATLPEFKGLSRDQIDAITYRDTGGKRVAFTGVLTIHAGDDGIHRSRFSLAMEDVPTIEVVTQIAQLIHQSGNERLGDGLDFEVLPHQAKGFAGSVIALKGKGIDVYDDGEDPSSVSYTEGWNSGTLVVVESQEDLNAKVLSGEVNAESIVLAKTALRELPAVAGVISAETLTPASHTVLLAQMYGAPVVYFKDAESRFSGRAGKRVFLAAKGDPRVGLNARAGDIAFGLSVEDVARLKELRQRASVSFSYDPTAREIVNPKTLTRADVGAYGGKSSQSGTLLREIPENSLGKEALAIPLAFSVEFLNTGRASNGQTLRAYIDEKIKALGAGQVSDQQLEALTSDLREQILNADLPVEYLNKIKSLLETTFTGASEKLRLRSSSNVEDGTEFNGAGLYESEGYWLRGKKTGNLAKNLKSVISSLYTKRAYAARRAFGVDEQKIGMGILVHRAFQEEIGNGVIRFIWDMDRKRSQFEIVTLLGDENQVTRTDASVSAEIVRGSRTFVTVDKPYEGYSKERSLFPKAIYLKLAEFMEKLAKDFDRPGMEIDIESEFKLMPVPGSDTPAVFLKQVRPVPHPTGGKLADGSRYVVLGGEHVLKTIPGDNNTNALANLILPKEVTLRLPTFTEAQIQAGKLSVESVEFMLDGKKVYVKNPKVALTVSAEADAGYSLEIFAPSPGFPTLSLTIEDCCNPFNVHSLASGQVSYHLAVGEADLGFLDAVGGASGGLGQRLEVSPGSLIQKDKQPLGTIEITSPAARVLGRRVHYLGDGDGRSITIGEATIENVFKRPLVISASAIGYGANHHEGQESFAFDLLADQSLTASEREEIQKNVGRYLWATDTSFEGEGGIAKRLISIRPDGKVKEWGEWKSEEVKTCEDQLVTGRPRL